MISIDTLSEYFFYEEKKDDIILRPKNYRFKHLEFLFNTVIKEYKIRINEDNSIVLSNKEKKKYNRAYTSGCFDLFHYGHLNIFKKTKEQCNHMIVGVSTDDLILKEKGRLPVIPFEERVKIIESIKYVDEVIPQESKNKQAIVDKYNIDAISVGDDWKGKYPKVTCNMIYIPYTQGISSTSLKEALEL